MKTIHAIRSKRVVTPEGVTAATVHIRNGAIAAGYDADIVVWNPEKHFIVRSSMLQHRHKLTPYLNESLRGQVETTFLGGEMIYDRGRFLGTPRGTLLRRGER